MRRCAVVRHGLKASSFSEPSPSSVALRCAPEVALWPVSALFGRVSDAPRPIIDRSNSAIALGARSSAAHQSHACEYSCRFAQHPHTPSPSTPQPSAVASQSTLGGSSSAVSSLWSQST